jgi:hypothetical protein
LLMRKLRVEAESADQSTYFFFQCGCLHFPKVLMKTISFNVNILDKYSKPCFLSP